MKAATSRVLLVLSAFLAGLVVFFTVILIVTGRNPAPGGGSGHCRRVSS